MNEPKLQEVPATPVPAVRTKSQETILKQAMRDIKKDLATIDKDIAEFEAMEKSIAAVRKSREAKTEEFEKVKAKLIKHLGLD